MLHHKTFILILCMVVIAGAVARDNVSNEQAKAAIPDTLSGWAWAANKDAASGVFGGVGWISFNCTNQNSCANSNYGVTTTGAGNVKKLSGWAWSSNIGWIAFDESRVSGCNVKNTDGTCAVRIDTNTGVVSGWARAYTCISRPGCQGNPSNGWDGWIRFNNATLNKATCTLGGYAWGGAAADKSNFPGWIHFAGSTYGVKILPTVCNPLAPVADIKANAPGGAPSDVPISIDNNSHAFLTWTSTNATSCSVAPVTAPPAAGWTGLSRSAPGQNTGNLTRNTTYTLTCSNGSLTDTDTVTVNVSAAGIPGVCGAADGVSSPNPPSSNLCSAGTPTPVTQSGTNWTWVCQGISGGPNSPQCSAPIAPPTGDIKANARGKPPTGGSINIISGTQAYITWNSTNANNGCTVTSLPLPSVNWSGISQPSPGRPTGNLTTDTTYTLTCNNHGVTSSDSVTVSVSPPVSVSLFADPHVGDVPFPSTLTASIVSPLSGFTYTYVFKCGDGSNPSPVSYANTSLTSVNAVCRYATRGTWRARVDVTRSDGSTDYAEKDIIAKPALPIYKEK